MGIVDGKLNMKFFGIETKAPLKPQSRIYDLKIRLDWGSTALTIIDVRPRHLFNQSHIIGALPIPLDELVTRISKVLELSRDIYIYGETDEDTARAAEELRAIGYQNVSQLRGGVAAWKAVGYPIGSIVGS